MTDRVAIVTGGLRGLGRSMTLGLAGTGVKVLAVGHIDSDMPSMTGIENVHPFVGDIRKPEGCDRIVAEALKVFGRVDILVNNAGLTFTTIEPDRYRRDQRQKFWEVPDGVIQAVMDTNYVGSDQMARRVAPLLVAQGWGRIVNVTTKLSTMNVPGAMPYGASKAALEMATASTLTTGMLPCRRRRRPRRAGDRRGSSCIRGIKITGRWGDFLRLC